MFCSCKVCFSERFSSLWSTTLKKGDICTNSGWPGGCVSLRDRSQILKSSPKKANAHQVELIK